MKILVNGSGGHMGQIICSMAKEGRCGTELGAQIDPKTVAEPEKNIFTNLNDFEGEVDCVVDFSNHAATKQLLDYCIANELPVVIATTGQTEAEKDMINAAARQIPVFFSANMSVGVAVLADIARKAAAAFPEADIEIIEKHHNRKLDVPSGTALMLANAIHDVRESAEFVIGRHENGKRQPKEIGIHSIRLGNEVGTHEIIISNGNETITLRHEAENRALFAEGALRAAAFLAGKPAGLYTMKDMIQS
ncbi:MAG: 4-hydroxy-tetrahydrodipicolinate reductase [Anaerolineaceae bacterium]|nr:4-hydroxy-tetrahydrodipicolinate reductase [Anaerolineaceae bacterium]